MTGSELVAVPDFSLLHDFCHGLIDHRNGDSPTRAGRRLGRKTQTVVRDCDCLRNEAFLFHRYRRSSRLRLLGLYDSHARQELPGPLPPLTAAEETFRDELRRHVEKLAGEIGERNLIHYTALGEAADYVHRSFERGFEQAGYGNVERQTYDVAPRSFFGLSEVPEQPLACANLIAEIPGSEKPAEIVRRGSAFRLGRRLSRRERQRHGRRCRAGAGAFFCRQEAGTDAAVPRFRE